MTIQQKEALRYFKQNVAAWNEKAVLMDHEEINIIQQRNNYVIYAIENRHATVSAMDVGCGAGGLVCNIAQRGIAAVGIDFAEEMINEAQENARKKNLANAQFYCASIFDYDCSTTRYDVISANGFIEYISLEQLNQFLAISYKALNPSGSLIVHSRNRLFNLLSLNRFTLMEIESGCVIALLKEAVSLASCVSIGEMSGMKTAPLQNSSTRHPKTSGIEIATRYQYTPMQLLQIFMRKGFEFVHIYPIHIHGVTPMFKDKNPAVHAGISNLLQSYAGQHPSLLPYCSGFMLHVQKK